MSQSVWTLHFHTLECIVFTMETEIKKRTQSNKVVDQHKIVKDPIEMITSNEDLWNYQRALQGASRAYTELKSHCGVGGQR